MQSYLMPIFIAGVVFVFLAVLLTLPFSIFQYRKYGYFSFWKTALLVSFIFYSLSAYFLVIFPMPFSFQNCGEVPSGKILVQTRPFQFIRDIQREVNFHWIVPSTYANLLSAPSFYVRFFNVLLLFPLGVYIRYFFKNREKWQYAALMGLGVSLFFEITQRTAVFDLFACPYRVFDVDDLLANTAGAVLGFLIAPLFLMFIPSKDALDRQEQFYDGQQQATFGAQLFEVLLNVMVAKLLANLISPLFAPTSTLGKALIFAVAFYFLIVILPAVWRGQTIGGKIIRARLIAIKGSQFRRYNRRFWILYMPFLFSATSRVLTSEMKDDVILNLAAFGLAGFSLLVWLVFIGHLLVRWGKKDDMPFYNRYAGVMVERMGKRMDGERNKYI
ncbi:VanZ family protein [Sporosarcina newyorkensis]|uniref:Glycopeptide antibiotics resistance protein n=1 Tax=Sporosarcina newyorkensis TaxID=759851 RepID=A0A1T4XLH8_9BACL|nr:VanZ family protein [Sporosarcina newyorkensis]SKA89931.1 Glycopeptide antibiotics resistance protein [Sporosarcina newyorkensis]